MRRKNEGPRRIDMLDMLFRRSRSRIEFLIEGGVNEAKRQAFLDSLAALIELGVTLRRAGK